MRWGDSWKRFYSNKPLATVLLKHWTDFEWLAAYGVVSSSGIEPETHALKVRCSTN
jgi:hypothetical protein